MPAAFVAVNLAILAAVVFTNHDPEAFMGLFLLFLGLAEAYRRHHDRLLLREGLMVAFFLAGLVVLGGQQRWWLQDVLSVSTNRPCSTALPHSRRSRTTRRSRISARSSKVFPTNYKYSLVAGAVAGGGLTVIANAPNPAGFAILKDHFEDQSINAFGLFIAALPPTLVAIVCFRGIQGQVDEIFDWDLWAQWFAGLDRSFLFLLILPFVVAAVGLWAEFARRDDK